MPFESLDDLRRACRDLPSGDDNAASAVTRRQDTLTKPQGSLGRLETIAAWLARWQGRDMPRLDRVKVFVFAGNHGVTAQGVSAFPSEVTVQMVANFAGGGAAINQLARVAGAELDVIPLELERPTGDFTQGPAMEEADFLAAVSAGYDAVDETLDLVCFGEMGIGNDAGRRDLGRPVRRRRREMDRARHRRRRRRAEAQGGRHRGRAEAPRRGAGRSAEGGGRT